MVIRSTVKPKEKSPEEASEDRQISTPKTNVARTTGEQPIVKPGAAEEILVVAPASPQEILSTPLDEESGIDSCPDSVDDITPDEDLPAAEGGVEK